MENNENLVLVTENVEQTTEETVVEQPKMFTQDEVNEIVGKNKARERAKLEKQYQRKYGDLLDVLKTGTGEEDVGKITEQFRSHYEKRGVQFEQKPSYTDKDIEVLARAEANDIINSGYDDVVDEVERLAELGTERMTAREKALFKVLAEHRQKEEYTKELSSIGVTKDVYESEEFKSFAKQFNPTTPIKDVYDIYRKTQPQKEFRTMGSIKNTPVKESGVKEFYSKQEAEKFSLDDLNKNPELYKAIVNSSYKWK
jgi:hypothetical protein